MVLKQLNRPYPQADTISGLNGYVHQRLVAPTIASSIITTTTTTTTTRVVAGSSLPNIRIDPRDPPVTLLLILLLLLPQLMLTQMLGETQILQGLRCWRPMWHVYRVAATG